MKIPQATLHPKIENESLESVFSTKWHREANENRYIAYMYEKTGDIDMIRTFLSENDSLEINRPSSFTGYDGNRAYGICQLYETYHRDFINSADFQDPYKQIDYCIEVWNKAKDRGILHTTFYAYNFRFKNTGHLVIN